MTARWRVSDAGTATTEIDMMTTATEMVTTMGVAGVKTARLPLGVASFGAAPGLLAVRTSGQAARATIGDEMTATPAAAMMMVVDGTCRTPGRSTMPRFSAFLTE